MHRSGLILGGVFMVVSGLSAHDLSKAEELYRHTAYEESLNLLDKKSSDAATNFLVGRDYFMIGDFKRAVRLPGQSDGDQPGEQRIYGLAGARLRSQGRDG